MAKYKGFLKIAGSLGPLTMYQLHGEWVVRKRYGPDAKTMASNENYAPQRNHGKEFGGVSRASKLLREGFRSLAKEIADPEMHGRMNKTLNAVKNLDTSPKGERTVAKGLQTAEGRAMLSGWNANMYSKVAAPAMEKARQALTTSTFDLLHKEVTEGSKTVEVTVIWMRVDFEKGIYKAEECAPVVLEPGGEANLERPATLDTTDGIPFIVLAVRELVQYGNALVKSGDRKKMGLVVV